MGKRWAASPLLRVIVLPHLLAALYFGVALALLCVVGRLPYWPERIHENWLLAKGQRVVMYVVSDRFDALGPWNRQEHPVASWLLTALLVGTLGTFLWRFRRAVLAALRQRTTPYRFIEWSVPSFGLLLTASVLLLVVVCPAPYPALLLIWPIWAVELVAARLFYFVAPLGVFTGDPFGPFLSGARHYWASRGVRMLFYVVLLWVTLFVLGLLASLLWWLMRKLLVLYRSRWPASSRGLWTMPRRGGDT